MKKKTSYLKAVVKNIEGGSMAITKQYEDSFVKGPMTDLIGTTIKVIPKTGCPGWYKQVGGRYKGQIWVLYSFHSSWLEFPKAGNHTPLMARVKDVRVGKVVETLSTGIIIS